VASTVPPARQRHCYGSGNIFDSEHAKDIEAGLKYRGDAATFNIAVYKQWIEDAARRVPDPDGAGPLASIAVTANVPEAEVQASKSRRRFWRLLVELGLSGAHRCRIHRW
jgi:hypothetical protein